MSLPELKARVLEDGVIDADEVTAIRTAIYEDGVIDKEEADFLFEVNDAVSGKENDAGWNELFATALCDYVTEDEETPNVVDEEEAKYIVEKIEGDGQVDDAEKLLLSKIKAKATIIHPTLGSFMDAQGI